MEEKSGVVERYCAECYMTDHTGQATQCWSSTCNSTSFFLRKSDGSVVLEETEKLAA